jgi:hypothetical protein
MGWVGVLGLSMAPFVLAEGSGFDVVEPGATVVVEAAFPCVVEPVAPVVVESVASVEVEPEAPTGGGDVPP